MNIDSIVARLTADQKSIMESANTLAGRIFQGSHLDEWMSLGVPLATLRTEAMMAVHANQPKGTAYNEFFTSLIRRLMPNCLDGSRVHPYVAAVLWLHEDDVRLSILADYRGKLDRNGHAHLNTPKAAQNAVMREQAKVRAAAQQAERDATMTDLERDMADQMKRDNFKPTVSDQQIIDGFLNRGIATLVALMMGADELKMLELAQKILQDNDLNMTSAEAKIRRMKKAKRDALKQPAEDMAD